MRISEKKRFSVHSPSIFSGRVRVQFVGQDQYGRPLKGMLSPSFVVEETTVDELLETLRRAIIEEVK